MGDCLLWTGVLRLQIKSKMFCSSWHQMCIGVAMGMQSRARCANRATPQLSTTMFRPDPCTSTSTSTACMQQHEYEVLQQHHIHQRHYCLQQQQQWSHRVSFCQLQSIFCSSIQASTCYDANEEQQHCCPSLSLSLRLIWISPRSSGARVWLAQLPTGYQIKGGSAYLKAFLPFSRRVGISLVWIILKPLSSFPLDAFSFQTFNLSPQ